MRLSTNSYPITLDFSTQTSFTYFMAFSIVSIVSRPQAGKVIFFFYLFFFPSLRTSHLYESKFILDSFIFRVSPARFLRWFAAIVDFSTRSRVCSCDLFGINQVRFLKWLDSIVDFFTQSHDFSTWVWCAENHVRSHPNDILAIHPIAYPNL